MKAKKKNIAQEAAWSAFIERINVLLSQGKSYEEIGKMVDTERNVVWEWVNKGKGGKRVPFEVMRDRLIGVGLRPEDFFEVGEGSFTEIPWLEATASMGGGSYEASKEVRSHLSFQTSWLMSKGAPSRMVVISTSGGSMEPTIPDGAIVLIDESKKYDLVNGKIYFVAHDSTVFLKRIRLEKGKPVALLSDRGDEPILLDGSEYFEVIGQAVWYGKDL